MKNGVLKYFPNFTQSLFNEVAGIQRLQHRRFLVKFGKFLRTYTLKNICNSNLDNSIKDCISLAVLEGFLQSAPRKEPAGLQLY